MVAVVVDFEKRLDWAVAEASHCSDLVVDLVEFAGLLAA